MSNIYHIKYFLSSAVVRIEKLFKKDKSGKETRNHVPLGIIKSKPNEGQSLTLLTGHKTAVTTLLTRLLNRLAVEEEEKACIVVPQNCGADLVIQLLSTNLCADFTTANNTWAQGDYLEKILSKRLNIFAALNLSIVEGKSISSSLSEIPLNEFKYLFISGFPFDDPASELTTLKHYSDSQYQHIPIIIANNGNLQVAHKNHLEQIQSYFHMDEINKLEHQLTVAARNGNYSNSPFRTLEKSIVKVNSSKLWIDYIETISTPKKKSSTK